MSDIKMSDYFKLPISNGAVKAIEFSDTVEFTNDGVAPFNAAAVAINNYDRIVEENAKFKSSNNEQITDLKKIYVMLHEFYDDHDFDGSTCDLAIVDLIYKMEGK